MKKTLFLILLLFTVSLNIYSLGAGTTNADFLKIGVGGRPAAMGNAYISLADDASGSFWNPAGITALDKINITFMHLFWFESSFYDYFSGVMPIDNLSNIGISMNLFMVPSFNSTIDYTNVAFEEYTLSSYDLAVTLTYARILGDLYTKDFTIGNISVGGNLTYIKRELLGIQLDPIFLIDLGIIANITDTTRAGFVIQNLGTSLKEDPAPFNIGLGISNDFRFSKEFGFLLSMDINKPVDITNPEYKKWFFSFGGEMNILNTVYLRGGYIIGKDDITYSAGGGISISNLGSIDYAFLPHRELGDTHRISVSVKFGNVVKRPEVGAPQPPQEVIAIAGDKVVSIGWAPNREANIIGYNIYYKKKGEKKFKKLNKEPVMDATKFKAILKNGITYDFVVTAVNNRKLESLYSKIVSATPHKYTPKKPKKVTGVFIKVKKSSLVIMWNESRDKNVMGYNLYYKKSGDLKYKRLNRKLLRETKATLAGLNAGVEYEFVVTAVSKDGLESDFSESVKGKIKEKEEYF